jgi:hypothetical protein
MRAKCSPRAARACRAAKRGSIGAIIACSAKWNARGISCNAPKHRRRRAEANRRPIFARLYYCITRKSPAVDRPPSCSPKTRRGGLQRISPSCRSCWSKKMRRNHRRWGQILAWATHASNAGVWECIKDCTTMRAPEEINPPLPVLARDLDVIRICGFL